MINRNDWKGIKIPRLAVLGGILSCLFFALIVRLYQYQIIDGERSQEQYMSSIKKSQRILGTRGRIFDRNGTLLAENRLSYDLTLEDCQNYKTKEERQGTLNGIAYQLISLVNDPDKLNTLIPIDLDENGRYLFNAEGFRLNRFKADLFGKTNIEEMSEKEASMTASEIVDYLCSEDMFFLSEDNSLLYTKGSPEQYGLPKELTPREMLQILNIRYGLFLNSYRKYLPFLVATDIPEETMAAVLENKNTLIGADIQIGSSRYYYGGESLSSILGYTGLIGAEELSQYEEEDLYTSQSVIGKSGIEKSMEEWLRGKDGIEQFYTDVVGFKKTDSEITVAPEAGNDVYLTIDKELQEAVYQMLEQQIAGIVLANMVNTRSADMPKTSEASQIRIPIDDVFTAFFKNHVIDTENLKKETASQLEKEVFSVFAQVKEAAINELGQSFDRLFQEEELSADSLALYQEYIVKKLAEQKVLLEGSGQWDRTALTLRDFLETQIENGFLASDWLKTDEKYMGKQEIENQLEQKIMEELLEDEQFDLLIYEQMVRNQVLSGYTVLKLLYEQGILSKEDPDYPALLSETLTEWEFVRRKLRNLEITPARLALNPCSGSAVVIDPQNGQVLACVSYPGYDNNRLANQAEGGYYRQLSQDLSLPMFNRATSQLTAPGSTFKPVTVAAGLKEGVITTDTSIICDGVFDKVKPVLRCWNRAGHGPIESSAKALQNSCNDYLCDITYRLGMQENGEFSEEQGLSMLQKYAALFDLDKNTGIELGEAKPQVTDRYAIPSSIGQGTHNYTTTQIARYAGILANHGTSYDLSLLYRVTDWEGNLLMDFAPKVQSQVELPEFIWQDIETGMTDLAASNATLKVLEVSTAGKTGTAEESKKRPNHGWFIGYAPVETPQIAVAVRVANGYSSGNVVGVGRDIFNYYFGLLPKEKILTGRASEVSNNVRTD